MARKNRNTATWVELAQKRACAREAERCTPSRQGVREVLAEFINERLDLSAKERVTPEWVGRNHDLAVKVVDLVRHKPKMKPPLGGPRGAAYGG